MTELESLPDLIDPSTGELLDPACVDALAEAHERLKAKEAELCASRQLIARRLAALTEGTAKTRRLRGERTRVKVEMPEPGWNQSQLKSVLNAYPLIAPKYLRIGSVYPIARELAKLRNETGDDSFGNFRDMVLAAELPPSGAPRITIEESEPAPAEAAEEIKFPF